MAKLAGSSKKMGTFRMLERKGVLVGMISPYYTPWRAPFTATAMKLTHIYGVPGSALAKILQGFLASDEPTVIGNIESEYAQITGKPGVQAQKELRAEAQAANAAAAKSKDGNEAARILAVADEGVASEIMSKVEKTGKDMELSAMALRDIKANVKKLPTILDAVKYVIEGGTKPTFTGFDRRASARASTVGLDVSKKSPSMKAKQVKGAGKGGYSGLTEKTACAHSTSQMGDEEAERERKQAMNLVMLG